MAGRDLRIVYMGTPEFAVAPLRALTEAGYNVVAVVTAPDKPAGRGLRIQESEVKRYASEAGLPVLQPAKLKDEAFLAHLRGLNADLGIVVAFRMLPEAVWSIPRLGTFNLHASLLPQYRGAAPINWAIMNGETRTGVTTFMLNDRMDEGCVLQQQDTAIVPEDNAGSLYGRLMDIGAGLVLSTVEGLAGGGLNPRPQAELPAAALKPAPKIFKDTCRIDFSRNGTDIVNHIRGLSPYPAAWGSLVSGSNSIDIKIFTASSMSAPVSGNLPGTIESDGRNYLRIWCADGYISVMELQPAGKKRMTTPDFLRGFKGIADYRFE